MIRNFQKNVVCDVDLTPLKSSLNSLSSEVNDLNNLVNSISSLTNLTTFTQSRRAITAGSSFKMNDWLTSEGNTIDIYGIVSSGYNTIGFWHTIDDSLNLLTTSDIVSHSGFTDYITNGWMNKSNITRLEGNVIDSLTNIGVYPWTNTIYDGYIFKYVIPYTNLSWNMPTLPENVKSITDSFILTNQGASPTLYFSNMNDVNYFNFNNTAESANITGTYNLRFNNQHIGTLDLINGPAAQFAVYSFKADEVNYSALSNKVVYLNGAVCPDVNILTPCGLCAFSSCELNEVKGHSEAEANFIDPILNSDLNIYDFSTVSMLTMISSQTEKDINLNNISMASLRSIACKDLNVNNVNTLKFTTTNYTYNININNIKLDNMTSAIINFIPVRGTLNYGEFNNINSLTLSMPTTTTFFNNGALIKNIDDVYVEYGTCLNFSLSDVDQFKVYRGTISGGENLVFNKFIGERALITDVENLSFDTLFGNELTINTIKNITINSYSAGLTNVILRNVDNMYFKELPVDGFIEIVGKNWNIENLNSSRLTWLSGESINVSNMTTYIGTVEQFGSVQTFNCDNLVSANASEYYGLFSVKDINIKTANFDNCTFAFRYDENINIENCTAKQVVAYSENTYNMNLSNVSLSTLSLSSCRSCGVVGGNIGSISFENKTLFMGALTLSDVALSRVSLQNLSYADLGGGSCRLLLFSNVLEAVNPFSYCSSVYIDVGHSANLTKYVLSWENSYTM